MHKEEITYTDFNGVQKTRTYYFALSKSDLMKLELKTPGGLTTYLERIVNANESPEIVDAFEKIILAAYGEKTDDGERFVKSAEISEAFMQSAAYDQFFMELLTDTDKAINFVNNIVPQDEAQKQADRDKPNVERVKEILAQRQKANGNKQVETVNSTAEVVESNNQ